MKDATRFSLKYREKLSALLWEARIKLLKDAYITAEKTNVLSSDALRNAKQTLSLKNLKLKK